MTLWFHGRFFLATVVRSEENPPGEEDALGKVEVDIKFRTKRFVVAVVHKCTIKVEKGHKYFDSPGNQGLKKNSKEKNDGTGFNILCGEKYVDQGHKKDPSC